MNILIPMAGDGQRFKNMGYKVHKPAIMTIDRKTGNELPMVICATNDLPNIDINSNNLIYIDRDFHKTDGIEDLIKKYYLNSKFISVDHLTEGQACTCLLAKKYIDNDEELLIAGCDNGMDIDVEKFNDEKKNVDCLVFTYRNNDLVLNNPDAYGWCIVDEANNVTNLSIKKKISNNPMNDHAIVATFWFKKGSDFVKYAEQMIASNDRINGEFYVDKVISYFIKNKLKVKVFEIQKYIGWGTPFDYEAYMNTYKYWTNYLFELEKIDD